MRQDEVNEEFCSSEMRKQNFVDMEGNGLSVRRLETAKIWWKLQRTFNLVPYKKLILIRKFEVIVHSKRPPNLSIFIKKHHLVAIKNQNQAESVQIPDANDSEKRKLGEFVYFFVKQ